MFWAITGGIVVGGIGLGALYDFIVRRRGSQVSVSESGPMNANNVGISFTHDEFNHL
jgi:hypothetical protein